MLLLSLSWYVCQPECRPLHFKVIYLRFVWQTKDGTHHGTIYEIDKFWMHLFSSHFYVLFENKFFIHWADFNWFLLLQKTVIQTKSVEFMPFFLSLFVFLNCSAWTIYSFLPKKDFYIAVFLFHSHIFHCLCIYYIPNCRYVFSKNNSKELLFTDPLVLCQYWT